MLNKLIYWIRVDDSELGVPKLPGAPSSQELARPMMLLNVLTEFCGNNKSLREKYSGDFDWAVQAIVKHVCPQLAIAEIGNVQYTKRQCVRYKGVLI